jgi:hypothetical protein
MESKYDLFLNLLYKKRDDNDNININKNQIKIDDTKFINEKEELSDIKKNRCFICKKKIGLDYFRCDCDSKVLFCSNHRFSYSHNCTKDIKKENQIKLKETNPKIIKEKFEKI